MNAESGSDGLSDDRYHHRPLRRGSRLLHDECTLGGREIGFVAGEAELHVAVILPPIIVPVWQENVSISNQFADT